MSGSEETINVLPAAGSAFLTDLIAFLRQEDAKRFNLQFTPFVQSGGIHGTGAGLTGAPSALVAFPGGFYTTETGSITYPNNSTIWVICHKDLTGDQGVFTRVAGTHYLTFVGVNQPTLPADCIFLMTVTTSGGSISAVTDIRPTSPLTGIDTFSDHIAASGVVTPTATPSLTQVAGGALGARTYFVKFTYVNAVGETQVSAESSLAVSANNLLQVNSPAASGDATGYNVYVDTISGSETLQSTAPVNIGAAWIEPASGLIAGAAVPAANTTFPHVQGVKLDQPQIVSGLYDGNGNEWLELFLVASAVNNLRLRNAATGNNPRVEALGGDANVGYEFQAKGTGLGRFLDGNGNEIVEFLAGVASALNYVGFTNAATGGNPFLSALGGDANIGVSLRAKGSGLHRLLDGNGNKILETLAGVASAVNYLALLNAATGNRPQFQALGSDSNIGLDLVPKGTGRARVNALDVYELGGAIDRDTSSTAVSNTTTETTVYSYSVPANLLGTDRMLRLILHGNYNNNSGANKVLTVRVKFGSTTLFTSAHAALASSASDRIHRLDFTLQPKGATNAQIAFARSDLSSAGAATGTTADAGEPRIGGHESSAEDTTGALTLSVTVQHDAASASLSYTMFAATLELI